MAVRRVLAFKGRTRGHLRAAARHLNSLVAWQQNHPTWPVALFSNDQLTKITDIYTQLLANLTQTYVKPG